MKKYITFLFIFILQNAQAQRCGDLFKTDTVTAVRNTKIDWDNELSEMPHLNELLQKYLADPAMPVQLKYMLQKAFVSNDVEIRNFTKEIKKKYSFDPQLSAFAGNLKWKFKIKARATKNFNDAISDPAERLHSDKSRSDGWFHDRFFVAVEDGSLYQVDNPLLIFMHEMAHIRFHIYFDRHVSDLVGKFPADLISKDKDNVIEMDTDLYSYLQERYAHEVEFTVLKSIKNTKYLFSIPNKWVNLSMHSNGPVVKKQIATMIRHGYGLRDERFVFMDNQKISSILLNGLDPRHWKKPGLTMRQLFNF